MNASRHVIEARDVHFAYRPAQPVLSGASLQGPAGRLVCVLGPNGSGKTTLLRCLLGQLKPQSGMLLLDGRELSGYSPKGLARMVAYVPQFPRSAFSFTAGEIVLMGRYAHTGVMGLTKSHDLAVAREAMKMTHTLELARRTLEELSGGEAQCVMIARALAQQPSVMLLDEPTSHLDVRNQLMIYRMQRRLADDWGMAVICVSHDVNLAARFADELVLMRDGKVLAAGKSQDVIRADVLERAYDVKIKLIPAPGQSVPYVRAD